MRKDKIKQLFLSISILLICSWGQAQTKNSALIVDIPLNENESIADLKAVDLNNDGADELIISTGSKIYNYRWYGSYFQQIWTTTIWSLSSANGMQISDFDNDGKNDLLVSGSGMGYPSLSFFKNYGDIFIDQGYLFLQCPDDIFCAHDLNGDTLIDLATGSAFNTCPPISIQLYKHNSINHTVQYMGLLPDATNGANMVRALDINNDDKMDILGAEKYSGSLYTYLNEGDFNFTQTYTYQFPNYIFTIETADFDNDSLEDFVAAGYKSKLNFFRNEGDDEFYLVFSSSEDKSWNETVATDINHDGMTDLIAQYYKGHIYLFKNLGDFTFEEMIYPDSDTVSYAMTVGDFDGNGEIDIVYGKNPAHIIFDAINYFIPVSVYKQHLQFNKHLLISQNSPNPFKEFTTIEFDLKQSKSGELTIFDQTGKSILSTTIYASSSNINIPGKNLKPGVYFYQLKTDNGASETKKMIKIE